jgi:2'-5' RNA ligase
MALMRLFIGVGLGVGLAGYLEQWSHRGRAFNTTGFRLVAPRDYHLTLVFLGSQPPSVVPQIHSRLLEIRSRHAPFSCQLSGTGLLPSARRPRALVAHVECSAALRALHDDLCSSLQNLLVEDGMHGFRPHITLAHAARRSRVRSGGEVKGGRRTLRGTLPVSAITLYQSLSQPTSCRYRSLARVALNGR